MDMPSKRIRPEDWDEAINKTTSTNDIKGNSLVMRARGFRGIYNEILPLDLLWQFIDRHPFATSVSKIRFSSERQRQEAMRPIWNTSSLDINTEVSL
jgi:hypothetical protein